MPWDFALILLLLGVVVPWRGAVRVRKLLRQPQLTSADRLALYASTIAFQWFASGIVLWRALVRYISLSELAMAIPKPGLTVLVAVALSALVVTNQIVAIRRLSRLPPERHGFLGEMARKVMPQTLVESLAFVALVATVALCEEFIYRGFVQAIFEHAAASALLGVFASAIFFSIAHLYQGKRGLATTFLVGLIFAGIRVWTGSLIPTIAAHFAADLCAGLIGARWLRLPHAQSEPSFARGESSTG